jgi:hypothetical protein
MEAKTGNRPTALEYRDFLAHTAAMIRNAPPFYVALSAGNRLRYSGVHECCLTLKEFQYLLACIYHTIRLAAKRFGYALRRRAARGEEQGGPDHKILLSKSLRKPNYEWCVNLYAGRVAFKIGRLRKAGAGFIPALFRTQLGITHD